MKGRRHQNTKPRILAAVDLTHFNKEQRLTLLGSEQDWLNRRDLLKKMLGVAAVITLSAELLTGCKPSQACACESYETATIQAPLPITTPSGPTDTINITSPETPSPPVVVLSPKITDVYVQTLGCTRIYSFDFDSDMDFASFQSSVAVSPAPPNYDFPGKCHAVSNRQFQLFLLFMEKGKSYEIRIKGTCKDTSGNQLGDDFVYSFKVTDVGKGSPWWTPATSLPKDAFPRITAVYEADIGDTIMLSFNFDKDMDWKDFVTDMTPCVEISPGLSLCAVGSSSRELQIYLCPLTVGKQFSVKIKGILKDTNGNQLDGNGDGIGGDDFCPFDIRNTSVETGTLVWTPPTPAPTTNFSGCRPEVPGWGCTCEVTCGCQLYRTGQSEPFFPLE